MSDQLQFFASLEFPGRSTLQLWEIADRLGYTVQHLLNLIDTGELGGIDGKNKDVARRSIRVPVECYRAFIMKRLTNQDASMRMAFINDLPKPIRRQLIEDLKISLR